jgi:hypothetical protein
MGTAVQVARGLDGERVITLRNGAAVRLRPIRPDDTPGLIAFCGRLSPRTVYQRFFTVRWLRPEDAAALATVVPGAATYATAARHADHLLRLRLVNNRLIPTCLETRAVLAEPAADGTLTVHMASQMPHMHRRWIAETIGLPEHCLRVVAPDIGGGFGARCTCIRRSCSAPGSPCSSARRSSGANRAPRATWRPATAALTRSMSRSRSATTAVSSASRSRRSAMSAPISRTCRHSARQRQGASR